ncbi:hypothetical protein ACQ4M3_07420 [Leptolyngbya sp. AN03gr2]|uniref:hypothetical protein n=1 Tax=unclassified Leptolyngbya TaxID=2650499 RepID=UPI003D314A84
MNQSNPSVTASEAPTAKTREDVEQLKQNWVKNPSAQLHKTQGYEEFQQELENFQERVLTTCRKVQCTIGVGYYLTQIEDQMKSLNQQVEGLLARIEALEQQNQR